MATVGQQPPDDANRGGRLQLENEKLRRETELLEKYKDYRCCEGEMSTNVMEEGRKEAAKGE
jgi:hypothetical protein